jgi:D-alanine-D-alanine ligase
VAEEDEKPARAVQFTWSGNRNQYLPTFEVHEERSNTTDLADRDGLTIGFTYNLRKPTQEYDLEALRKYSEWDSETTVEAIVKALEETGNRVIRIPADKTIFGRLRELRDRLDIAFNIAEGMSSELLEGGMRESVVPTFLEYLQIPYTGSGPLCLAECLDKVRAKEIAGWHGVRTAKYQLVVKFPFQLRGDMSFPLVVKPVGEGSSIGLTQKSKVNDMESLTKLAKRITEVFHQPALIEEFIDGKEYTVGIVGRAVMPVMMIDLSKMPNNPCLRDQDVKDAEPDYTWTNSHGKGDPALSLAPFDGLYDELARMAVTTHEALRCKDYNRLDLREKGGRPYLLELNPLPGMHPADGDLPTVAKAAGISHSSLVNMVLLESILRYRSDYRFADRFKPDRVIRIARNVESTLAAARYYDLDVETVSGTYRLLRPVVS